MIQAPELSCMKCLYHRFIRVRRFHTTSCRDISCCGPAFSHVSFFFAGVQDGPTRRSSHGMNRKSSFVAHESSSAFDHANAMQTGVSHAHAAVADGEDDSPVPGGGLTPTKSRRAAARRSDVFRQQLLSPEKAGAAGSGTARVRGIGSPRNGGRGAGSRMMPHPSKLSWEGTRTRTRATKPRKRYSPILRIKRCVLYRLFSQLFCTVLHA